MPEPASMASPEEPSWLNRAELIEVCCGGRTMAVAVYQFGRRKTRMVATSAAPRVNRRMKRLWRATAIRKSSAARLPGAGGDGELCASPMISVWIMLPLLLPNERSCCPLTYHRQRRSGDGQLRGDLGPVAQAAHNVPGCDLVGHDNLVAGIQAQLVEPVPGKDPIDRLAGHHRAIGPQHEGMLLVRVGLALARE